MKVERVAPVYSIADHKRKKYMKTLKKRIKKPPDNSA